MFDFLFKRKKKDIFPIFIRKRKTIRRSQEFSGRFYNVQNISKKPEIINKIWEHFKSAKIIYYWFFEVQDWDYFDKYVFYSSKLKSWCSFTHRYGMFSEFIVHRTGVRYDIHYRSDLSLIPEFYDLLMNLYKKHKEEYLKDMNL